MANIVLRDRVIILEPGKDEDLMISGNVLRIVSSAVPVKIKNREGSLDFYLEAGERVEFDDVNNSVILSHDSGLAQKITISVGIGANVASAKVSGDVSILGVPHVVVDSLSGNVSVVDDGLVYGASFSNANIAVGGVPEVVVSPAANVNGIVILRASFFHENSSSPFNPVLSLIAKASAPGSIVDGDILLSADCISYGSSWQVGAGRIERPLKVGAGKGLYFMAATNGTGHALRSILYKLL